jgi:hypothetical protein
VGRLSGEAERPPRDDWLGGCGLQGDLGLEGLDASGDDLDGAPLGAVLRLPGVAVQPSLDVDEATLGEHEARDLGELLPGDDVVVLDTEGVVGGDPEGRDLLAVWGLALLGIGDEPSDEGDPRFSDGPRQRRCSGLAAVCSTGSWVVRLVAIAVTSCGVVVPTRRPTAARESELSNGDRREARTLMSVQRSPFDSSRRDAKVP